MFRRGLLTLSLVMVVSLAAALPATANNIPTTGAALPLDILGTTVVFPANTPFYVSHGFLCGPVGSEPLFDASNLGDCLQGSTRFVFFVDGVQQRSQTDHDNTLDPDGTRFIKNFDLTNYPAGMTGTHTFVYVWYYAGSLNLTATNTVIFS
jgi:hypothetical protein